MSEQLGGCLVDSQDQPIHACIECHSGSFPVVHFFLVYIPKKQITRCLYLVEFSLNSFRRNAQIVAERDYTVAWIGFLTAMEYDYTRI